MGTVLRVTWGRLLRQNCVEAESIQTPSRPGNFEAPMAALRSNIANKPPSLGNRERLLGRICITIVAEYWFEIDLETDTQTSPMQKEIQTPKWI